MTEIRHTSIPNTEHLTVRSEAKLQLKPDLAKVTLALGKTADTPAAAKANVDERSTAVISIAQALGISPDDIRATGMTLAPNREYRNREYIHKGYNADLRIHLTLRDLTLVSALMSRLVDVPIDSIVGIDTSVADEPAAQLAAFEKACELAKEQAEFLAGKFKAKLGPVFSIHTIPYERGFHIGSSSSSGDPVAGLGATFVPGTIEVTACIEVTYYLEKDDAY